MTIELPEDFWAPPKTPEEGIGLGDIGRALGTGIGSAISGAAGAAKYLVPGAEDSEALTAAQEYGEEGSRALIEGMSPRARRMFEAEALPGEGNDMWDEGVGFAAGSVGLKALANAPLMVASLFPAGWIARAMAGAGVGTAGAATAGALSGGAVGGAVAMGEVFNRIEEHIAGMSDDQLQKENEIYRGMRSMVDEPTARSMFEQEIAGAAPLIAGGIETFLGMFGAERLFAGAAAGAVTRGVAGRVAVGAVGEAGTEAVAEGSAELLTQEARAGATPDRDVQTDWAAALEAAAQGAAVGGPMGAAVGAVSGAPAPATDLDPSIAAATGGAPVATSAPVTPQVTAAPPVVPEATPTPNPAATPEPMPEAEPLNTRIARELSEPLIPAGPVGPSEAAAPAVGVPPAQPAPEPVQAAPEPPVAPPAPIARPEEDVEELGEEPVEYVDTNDPTPPPENIPVLPPTQLTENQRILTTAPAAAGVAPSPVTAVEPPPPGAAMPDEGAGPRVLTDLTAPDPMAAARGADAPPDAANAAPRLGKRKAEAAMRAGQAPVSDALTTNETEFGTPKDVRNVLATGRRMKAVADESGIDLDPDWAKLLDLQAKMKGRAVAKVKPEWMEVRRRIAAKSAEPAPAPVNVRAARRNDAEEQSGQRLATILRDGDYTDDVRAGKPKAIQGYIRNLLTKAKAAGIAPPTRVAADADPYLAHLAQARGLRDMADPQKLRDFMANDFALRQGDASLVSEYRAVEAQKSTANVEEDRGGNPQLDDDVDRTELADREDGAGEGAEVIETGGDAAPAREAEQVYAEPEARDRPKVEVSAEAVQAGKDRGGTFKVEARRGRQKLTAPNAPLPVGRAADLVRARRDVEPKPTDAQKSSGNYAKAHVTVNGLPITIETAKGGTRAGTARDGTKWSVRLKNDYGYLRRTQGADGDAIDVYVGPNPASRRVFIADQVDPETRKFDEHKVLMGFDNETDARLAYYGGFSDNSGPQRLSKLTEMSVGAFKVWLKTPQSKPVNPKSAARAAERAHLSQRTPQTEAAAVAQLQDSRIEENADTLGGNQLDMAMPDAWRAVLERRRNEGIAERLDATLKRIKVGQLDKNLRDVVSFFRERIMPFADARVRIVNREQMLRARINGSVPMGFYDTNDNTMFILDEALATPEMAARVIIHEGSHAALSKVIKGNIPYRNQIKQLMSDMHADLRRRGIPITFRVDDNTYGLLNPDEFIAEVMSNAEFREMLRGIPLSLETAIDMGFSTQSGNTLWDGFLAMVRRIFKLDPGEITLLDAALRTTEQGFALREARTFGPARSYSTVNELGLADVRADIGDRREGWRAGSRRFGLAVRTLDQIRQRYRGFFPTPTGDALERIAVAVRKMGTAVRQLVVDGHKHAETFVNLQRKDRAEAARVAQFQIDATMADFMPINAQGVTRDRLLAANPHYKNTAKWAQARAGMMRLQEQFMALDPASREYILDSAAYYRKTQNAIVRKLIDNILDTYTGQLSAAERTRLADHVITGSLTDADRQLLNDDVVFNDLRNARGLVVRNGLYFPLMRHGDHVVRGKAKIGNLHGGRVMGKNGDVIAFRAPTEKAARALMDKYAADPDSLDITSVGTKRILRSTGQEMTAAEAAGHDVDVEYRVRVQRQATWFFDSAKDGARFIRENKGQWEQMDDAPLPRADFNQRTDLTSGQFAGLMGALERRQDIDAAQKQMMRGVLQQAGLRLMSGNRVQQRAITRRNVFGASEDMARNMVQYAEAANSYLAKVTYMPEVNDAMKAMRAIQKDSIGDKLAPARAAVLNEIENRILKHNVTDIAAPSQIVQDIMALSFLDKLFSPAYSIINGMQPWMVTAPYLGGIYGNIHAGAALTRAYNSIGFGGAVGSGVANTFNATRNIAATGLDTTDIVGSIRKKLQKEPDAAGLTAMFDTLMEQGIIDADAGLEISGAIAGGRGRWGTGLAKVDRIARQLPLAVEAVNRSVTAVAAYRLAAAAKHPNPAGFALDAVMNTQGDYSPSNQPAFFNHPVLRPALQFKKYAQMMSALLVDMVQRAGFSTAEKRQATKQLLNIVGVQIVMAGALSLPGLELLKVGMMLAALLGGPGYDEFERAAREFIGSYTGEPTAEFLTRGFSRAAGIDISSRVGLNDMWTFGEPKSNDREGVGAYLFRLLGGAPGGLLVEWGSGIHAAASGDFMKAFGLMVPNKLIADTQKAVKGYSDREFTMYEAAAQAVGFRPRSAAEKSEEIGASIDKRKGFEERARELSRAYVNAKTKGELAKIKSQIMEHNKTKGVEQKQRVFPKGLDYVRERNEERRRAHTGRTE